MTDIRFVDANTEAIRAEFVAGAEKALRRTLYPGDPVRILAQWMADITVQERVNINHAAAQNLPRYAEGENLDALAELFHGARRLEAEAAKVTLRFTLSEPQSGAVTIPAGTRATADGRVLFATLLAVEIPAGQTQAYATAECEESGDAGNGLLPGQISRLVDVFPYAASVTNITESAGGADRETDAAFYDRMRESGVTWSTAGPAGGYEYHARSASALIGDVRATTPGPGLVDVRILLQGGELPDSEMLTLVETALSADDVRPLTDYVTVSGPDQTSYHIDLTYWTQRGAAGMENIEERVAAAVQEYIQWQGERMGRDINPSELHYRIKQTGVKRVEIREPEFRVLPDTAVAVLQDLEAIYGGVEDE